MPAGTVLRCSVTEATVTVHGHACAGCGGGHCSRRRAVVRVANPAQFQIHPGSVVQFGARPGQIARGALRLLILPVIAGGAVALAVKWFAVGGLGGAGAATGALAVAPTVPAAVVGGVAAGLAVLGFAIARGERAADLPRISEVLPTVGMEPDVVAGAARTHNPPTP